MRASDASSGLAGVSRGLSRSTEAGAKSRSWLVAFDASAVRARGLGEGSVSGAVLDAGAELGSASGAVSDGISSVGPGDDAVFARIVLAGVSGASDETGVDDGGSAELFAIKAVPEEAGLSVSCAKEAMESIAPARSTGRSIPSKRALRRRVFCKREAGHKGAGEFSHPAEALCVGPECRFVHIEPPGNLNLYGMDRYSGFSVVASREATFVRVIMPHGVPAAACVFVDDVDHSSCRACSAACAGDDIRSRSCGLSMSAPWLTRH